jgi:hypothetical protein
MPLHTTTDPFPFISKSGFPLTIRALSPATSSILPIHSSPTPLTDCTKIAASHSPLVDAGLAERNRS